MGEEKRSVKPPLGVKPGWIVAWNRIGDLADAIERQYESSNGDVELVRKFAEEIEMQCQIIKNVKGL